MKSEILEPGITGVIPGECNRLVGYVRVSTEGQALQGKSLQAQRQLISEYVQALQGKAAASLVEIYADEGISGTKGRKHRPGLNAALTALESGAACGIVFCSLDRLSRNAFQAVEMVMNLDKHYRVICIDYPGGGAVDTSNALARLNLRTMASFSEFFRDSISDKTKAILSVKRRNGEVYGPVPFGKSAVDGRLVDNPDELATLKVIHEYRKRGLGCSVIARLLNDKQLKTKRGGKWYPNSVKQILSTQSN